MILLEIKDYGKISNFKGVFFIQNYYQNLIFISQKLNNQHHMETVIAFTLLTIVMFLFFAFFIKLMEDPNEKLTLYFLILTCSFLVIAVVYVFSIPNYSEINKNWVTDDVNPYIHHLPLQKKEVMNYTVNVHNVVVILKMEGNRIQKKVLHASLQPTVALHPYLTFKEIHKTIGFGYFTVSKGWKDVVLHIPIK